MDLTHFCRNPAPEGTTLHERWTRAAKGLRSSPYQAVQAMTFAEEVILGDPKDERNPFRWSRVRLNLPGQSDFDASLPWVSKVRSPNFQGGPEVIASDVFIYVDDVRITGPTELEGWIAAQRVSAVLSSLGIQDAARKRREPARQDPGAWAGSVLRTDGDSPAVEVSMEKWTKAKALIAELGELHRVSGNQLPLLRLMQIRGFAVCDQDVQVHDSALEGSSPDYRQLA